MGDSREARVAYLARRLEEIDDAVENPFRSAHRLYETWGSPLTRLLNLRGRYVQGDIELEEFEAGLERMGESLLDVDLTARPPPITDAPGAVYEWHG